MKKEDCVFCQIIEGKISIEGKIMEDKYGFVFLSAGPNNFGHALVIPKEHYDNIYEIPDKTVAELGKLIKKTAIAIKKAVKADGINIGMNNEKAAGQFVFHAHWHIIPRYFNDGFKAWEQTQKYPDGKMRETAELIQKELE
jgi:histidine triad (HIT) family protein